MELQLFDDAIVWYSQSILVEPQHKYLAYFNKAKYIYEESKVKDFVEAISCLNEAIKIKRDCAELFHLKGLCLFELQVLF
jgi:tetratricopeptide (TPR) repeat protein